MTREEIIQAISDDKMMPFIQPEQLAQIVAFVVENHRPSLPSNLDEAALKAYPKMSRLSEPHGVIPADSKTHYLGDANEENRVAFKVGAEWMAGQGLTKEVTVGMATGKIIISVSEQTLDELDLCPGDKIVVQIRKKQ